MYTKSRSQRNGTCVRRCQTNQLIITTLGTSFVHAIWAKVNAGTTTFVLINRDARRVGRQYSSLDRLLLDAGSDPPPTSLER